MGEPEATATAVADVAAVTAPDPAAELLVNGDAGAAVVADHGAAPADQQGAPTQDAPGGPAEQAPAEQATESAQNQVDPVDRQAAQEQPVSVADATAAQPAGVAHDQQPPAQQQAGNAQERPAKRKREDGISQQAQEIIDRHIADGSFTPGTLDSRALQTLAGLPPALQSDALQQFFTVERTQMKNPSAYLSGITRTLTRSVDAATSQQWKGSRVSEQLDVMYRKEQLKPGDVDDKLMQRLQEEPTPIALLALDLFASNVPGDCRNRPAFLTSQLKVARQRLGNNIGGHGGGGGVGGGRDRDRGFNGRGGGGPPPPPPGGPRGGGMMMAPPPPGPPMMAGMGPTGMMMPGMLPGPPSMMMPGMMMPPEGMMMRPGSGGRGFGGRGGGPGRGGRMGMAQGGKPGTDFSAQQEAAGVRIDELHTCSDYAPYVHPYAALELQNLFDAGVGLVDQMDGGAWQQLAAMRAGEAVDLVNEVGHAIQDPKQTIRNVNAFFTAAAKKRAPDILQRAQALDAAISAGGDEYPSPPRRMGGGANRSRGGDMPRGGPQPETKLYELNDAGPAMQQQPQQHHRQGGGGGMAAVGGPTYGYGAQQGGMAHGGIQGGQQGMHAQPGVMQQGGMLMQQPAMQPQYDDSMQHMQQQPQQLGMPQQPQQQPQLAMQQQAPMQMQGQLAYPQQMVQMQAPPQQPQAAYPAQSSGGYGSHAAPVGGAASTGGYGGVQNGAAATTSYTPGYSYGGAAQGGAAGQMYGEQPQAQHAAPTYAAPAAQPTPELAQSVQQRISHVVLKRAGLVRFEHFDALVCGELAKLSVAKAMAALAVIEAADVTSTMDVRGLLLQTIRQHQ